MPLVLNEEQRMLRDSTRDFLRDHSNVDHFRELRDAGEGKAFDGQTWSSMAELGLSAIPIPEAHGGLDFGYLALGAVFEECGKQLTASPLLSSVVLGATLIDLMGNQQQKNALLPGIASGDIKIALALEESSHHAPTSVVFEAQAINGGYTLNGRKQFVVDGSAADVLLVVARTSAQSDETTGLSIFIVDSTTDGVSRAKTKMVDSRDYADISFTKLSIDSDSLLGDEGLAFKPLDEALDRGRACLAAEMLGGAQALFEKTVAYLKEREQFGAKIGSFQALQHRASMMYVELELTRSVIVDALSAIDEQRSTRAQAISSAKCRANNTFQLIANEAVQMHGGIGVTDELDVGLFFKRCRVAMQLLGNSGFHKDRFANLNNF